MRTLNYNIAENKRVDVRKFTILFSVFVVVSLLFCLVAGANIWTNRKDRNKDLQELRNIKDKFVEIQQNSQKYKQEIQEIQMKWKKQVRFANSLVELKAFSMVDRLNILEDQLPAGAFIRRLQLGNENVSTITISVMAQTFPKLVETYKNFAKFNLNVKNEIEAEGMYRANMTIFINNEKD